MITKSINPSEIEYRIKVLRAQKQACLEFIDNETEQKRCELLRMMREESKKDAKAILEHCADVGQIDRTMRQLFDAILEEL